MGGKVDKVISPCEIDILYDDGDREYKVPPQNCRSLADMREECKKKKWCKKGASVKCNWKCYGSYYGGKIKNISKSGLDIVYDDGDNEKITNLGLCKKA